jgi:hypothetical protein
MDTAVGVVGVVMLVAAELPALSVLFGARGPQLAGRFAGSSPSRTK